MLPPPAPMLTTFTVGASTGNRSLSGSTVVSIRLFTMMLTSKLVPPMSNPMILSLLITLAPIAPPTGPDISVYTAVEDAISALITPPLDCII